MMRATKALIQQRRNRGASVRFVRSVEYVGRSPRNACFANALKVFEDGLAPDGPRFSVAHGWLIIRYPHQTAVLQHAWNIEVATGRQFDVTELAEGTNLGAQYVEDVELRIALNATCEVFPLLVGRSFLFRDDKFYLVIPRFGPETAMSFDEILWTDFSTSGLLRR